MEGKERCRGRRKTSVAVGILLIAIAFIAVTPVTAQPVEVRVTPESVSVEEGETFVATIDVDSVTDLNSAQFDLSFDPDVVKVTDVKEGKIDGEDVGKQIFNWHLNPDKDVVVVISMMPIGEGVSGSGNLAEIEFKVKGKDGGKSKLNFSYGELTNISAGDISANWINATVTVGAGEGGENEEEPPEITECDPAEEVVSSTEGEAMTFKVTVDQTGDISWQINGTEVQTDEDVTEAAYTNVSAVVGAWNISAIATNRATGLSGMHTWIWNVTPTSTQEPGVTPTPKPETNVTETEGTTPTPSLASRETPLREATPGVKPTSTPSTEEKATPTPKVPGFEVIFAIAVLLTIAYLLLRRR
uniref:Uncharacterized protein n=1 Tax=Candidatus Methanophagaceae archaeon ANME-1 ERB6 TaxID=2759912 RepID=A0A7G9YZB2_9EURY|nr:hypothetical protein GMAEILFI_00018 [Methanosarcinales archaeon ANME-1 ERB6]